MRYEQNNDKMRRPEAAHEGNHPFMVWVAGAFLLFACGWSSGAKGAARANLNQLEKSIWTSPEEMLPGLESQIVRVIQTDPASVHAHLLLSQVYVRMFSHSPGDLRLLSAASDLAQQAIDLDPKSDKGYVALAMVLDTMGNAERGLALLADAERAGVEPSWRAYFTRSRLLSDEANTSQVLGLLKTALSFTDTQKDVIVPYVIALLQSEKSGEELLEELRAWNEMFASHLFDLTAAVTMADAGDHKSAHEIYKRILASDPEQKEAKVNDAILLYRNLGRPAEAVTMLRDVLGRQKGLTVDTRAMIHIHLGAAFLKMKQYPNANLSFVEGTKMNPRNLALLDFIVSRYKEEKQHEQLVSLIEALNNTTPGIGLLHALLGETLSEGLAQHRPAIQAFTNAIALEPSRSDYYNGMGLTYYRMKQYESALRLFVAATEVNPNDATARYNEACVLALMRRSEEALISLGDALSMDPKLQDHARGDEDFRELRSTVQFQQLVQQPPSDTAVLGH